MAIDKILSASLASGVLPTNTPSFRAYASSNFTTSNATRTIVPFGNVTFDIGNYFSTSTYRYTPLVAGYYNFFATVKSGSATDAENFVIYIRKNETEIMEVTSPNLYFNSVNGSVITYLDGVDDFVDVYVRQDSGGNLDYDGTDKKTYFQGFKLIGV
tara:strand:- start:224 stop:694 length:471 start_codon:yes stop_codon:yes gene_type:complete